MFRTDTFLVCDHSSSLQCRVIITVDKCLVILKHKLPFICTITTAFAGVQSLLRIPNWIDISVLFSGPETKFSSSTHKYV